jgi:hypothetical protein
MPHFGARPCGCEHPFDPCPGGVALPLPGCDFRFKLLPCCDASIKALAAQHADLDLDHVEPAGVLGHIVEFQPAQHPSGFAGRKGLVERAGVMCGQVVQHDPNPLGVREVAVSQLAHAFGEVHRGAAVSDLTLRQGRWTSTKMNRLAVPLRLYSQS